MNTDLDGSGPQGQAVSTGSPRLQYLVLVAVAAVVTSGALRLGVAPLLVLFCVIALAVLLLMTKLASVVHDARRARD
ncbi:hypothetical protein [Actinomadura sp. 7K507]|uniref:hypothetical protein n=1 Tax=Actinomadura sp. 7K507 TaxID=2530365 RepID=UPI001045365C|nr:hypothetical protein [Actinomadura sp. 7K507]TDC85859.1 hypothetical protein E1285_24580 [Actinomadura sp. 7K507]